MSQSIQKTKPRGKLALPLLCGMALIPLEGRARTLFDFQGSNSSRQWRAVNDGVMGGISRGWFRRTGEGSMLFAGALSLENNGGFASIRSSGKTEDLGEFDGISLRVRGDGRRYYFTIQTDFLIFAGSYRSGFDTVAGQWTEVRLPFKSFQATSFGRPLGSAPALNKRQVRSLGILLADKKSGPFELEIDWIRAFRGENESEANLPEKIGNHDTAQTGVKGTD